MIFRFPRGALRPSASSATALSGFLEYTATWEQYVGGAGGFLSGSTASGLRVTISSTLERLSYLQNLGYTYIMTARLSQDPIENLFRIVRQASGCNDHPTPTQFLITMNCLSFYNLIYRKIYGNVDPCAVSALLDTKATSSSCFPSNNLWDRVDALSDSGNLPGAEVALSGADHDENIERSDSPITYYVAGYAARKFIMKTKCQTCMDDLTWHQELKPLGLLH
ncbi:hypothetical protein HPB50_002684 [Hyalomma asiaticum]|uniref:Uncharacterized protein n=1 Tax=Hyalomma asiaticum TaxID=266040 RepID=A0ACB7TAZ8_HYAAI|nr:hypothetical protein HPB50_002684 [Hyalomma asiaticum]